MQATSGLELCFEAGMAALSKVLWMPQLKGEGLGFRVLVRSGHSGNVSCNCCSIHQWIGIRHGSGHFSSDWRRCGYQS